MKEIETRDRETTLPSTSSSGKRVESENKRELWARLNKAFGPILGGLIIDFFDLATFGPIGILMGVFIGGIAGYWVGMMYEISTKYRAIMAAVAGIYCAIPGTGLLPFATIAGAFARFLDTSPEKKNQSD